jgi:ADP-ribose pyrophosphatase YjhB (NUDIX family)
LYIGFRVYCFIYRPVRIGVRTLMVKDDKVWLVRHTYLPGWFMPGGGLKRGETLEQAARREAHEETGAKLGEVTLMGVYSSFVEWKSDHAIVFICKDFTTTGQIDSEIAEVRAFPLNKLPHALWPSHRLRLEEYAAGKPQPQFGEW